LAILATTLVTWKNPYGKYPQYPQFPQFQQSYPTFPPQYYHRPAQQTQPHNLNPQLSFPFPQRPNQLPTQPLPNPNNNKNSQLVYNIKGQNFQTYMITPLDLNNVQLRSGRILEKNFPSVVI